MLVYKEALMVHQDEEQPERASIATFSSRCLLVIADKSHFIGTTFFFIFLFILDHF